LREHDGRDGEAALLLLRVLLLLYAAGRGLVETTGLTRMMSDTAWWIPERVDQTPTYGLWAELEHLAAALRRRAGRDGTGPNMPLLDPHPEGESPKLRIRDSSLHRVLEILSVAPGSEHGAPGPAYAHRSIRDLGDAYEVLMARSSPRRRHHAKGGTRHRSSPRKKAGRYYTPDDVVRYVVRKTLGRLVKGLSSRQILGVRILDPAMGSGHFLLGAADFLAGAYGRARVREGRTKHGRRIPLAELSRYKRRVIDRCLYGVDTDPVAVEIARLSLWIEAGGARESMGLLGKHLRCGDALSGETFKADTSAVSESAGKEAGTESSGQRSQFKWWAEFPELIRGRGAHRVGFDAVIGNPPYLSFSGRQAPPGTRPAVSTGRAGRVRGWPSTHGRFILKATELVNNRGAISFVTPGQVGLLPGYAPVRSILLDVCDLIEVRYWGEDVFRGVTTPVLTFLAARRNGKAGGGCRLLTESGAVRRLRPRGGGPWFVSPLLPVFHRMAALHGTIPGFSDPGVHTGNAAAGLLLPHRGPGAVPIIEGRQIHPFRCDPPGRWLNLNYKGSRGEYYRISSPVVYRETDILIRQTASRPVAARHTYRCHFRNSALALRAPDGFSAEYLLGVLNSDVAADLYQAYSPETLQRSFPQIKVGTLRRLPIPDPRLKENRRLAVRIARLARSLEVRAADGREMGRQIVRLNLLVRALYGL
jgi:hypothetical protein